MVCPCCKNIIKPNEEKITCFRCEIPQHKVCWEKNNGCCTSGCYENPLVKSKAENVGNKTLIEILGKKNKTEHLDAVVPEPLEDEPVKQFSEEFKSRYKEKLNFKFRRRVVLSSSLGVIAVLIIVSAIFTYTKLNEYFSSEDYNIHQFMKSWESAWESRDILKYRELLDPEYRFIDKAGKTVSLDDRVKSIAKIFDSGKKVTLKYRDVKISYDTVNSGYANVEYNQILTIDGKTEKGIKVLRLFKSSEKSSRWLVFREYYERVN